MASSGWIMIERMGTSKVLGVGLLSDWHFPFPRSRWDWDSNGIPLCISFVVPTKALQRRVRRVISLSHNTPSYSSYTTHGHDLTFFSVILR